MNAAREEFERFPFFRRQAFANAWSSVFSRNYRIYMSRTESYSKGFDPNDYTEPGSSSRT